tara:strand:- start:1035 stop:1934 length:900 start_codon:yes stop_codon:yes gene_type:complete
MKIIKNIFNYLIVLGPLTLIWYIDWYLVLIIYNILFAGFGIEIWTKTKNPRMSIIKAATIPLVFNLIGLVYVMIKILPYEESSSAKEKKTLKETSTKATYSEKRENTQKEIIQGVIKDLKKESNKKNPIKALEKIIQDFTEITICGNDNMSGYGKCNVSILVPNIKVLEILEEEGVDYDDFDGGLTLSQGRGIEIIESYSNAECVLVERYQVFDKENQIYYEVISLEFFNNNLEDRFRNIYKYAKINIDGPNKYIIMNKEQIRLFNNDWDYQVDNRYFGYDFYTTGNFDLELETTTGYS